MQAPAWGTLRRALALLATRRFGAFWFASLLSSIGTWTQQVAEPWLLLALGASPFLIGLDSFAMNAPIWLLTLAGGALADRSDRRRVIARYQSIQMLCPILIVGLLVSGHLRSWMIVALSVVVGVTDALSMPSFQSIVPSIVRREQIGAALALNSTQFSLSRILGPSLAAVLMSGGGTVACFAVSAGSYLPLIAVASWILPRWVPAARDVDAGRRAHPLEGFRDVLREPYLRGALLSVLTTGVFCAPLVTFIPVLVKEVFHGGADRFSVAVVAFGVGGILGAGGLLSVPASVDRRRVSLAFAIAYGTLLVLAALMPWYWGIPPALVLAGASMTVSGTAANSLVQASAPSRLLGRAVSLYMLAMRGGIALGALLTGAAASLLDVRHALVLDGLLAVGLQVALARAWLRSPVPSLADDESLPSVARAPP